MFKTKEIVNIAMICALAVVLSLVVFLRMPNGGSITFYLTPLFLAATNSSLRTNFFIAVVTATLQILITGIVFNPVQVLLDYYIPVGMLCCSQVLKFNHFINIGIAACIALLSYTISGMIFFNLLFIPSLTYNAIYFIPTIIINLIIYSILNPRLKKLFAIT